MNLRQFGRRLGQWGHIVLGSLLMLAIWVLLVWVGSRPNLKFLIDMSPQQRGTIDPITIELLSEMADEQVEIEFHTFFRTSYFMREDDPRTRGASAEHNQRQSILARLRELTSTLLRQYEFWGEDTVRVVEHDMYGDITGTREARARFGGVDQMDDVLVVSVARPGHEPRWRQLSLEGDLAVVDLPEMREQSPVRRAQVPVLKDYKGEEAISSALRSLQVQGAPRIYFLQSNSYDLALQGSTGAGYSRLWQSLVDLGFDPQLLDLSNSAGVPKDAALVAVLEPRREFASTEVRALSEYVRGGGRLFINYSFSNNASWNPTGGELGELFGYTVGAKPIFHPMRTLDGQGVTGDPRVSKLDLVANPRHPITRRIGMSNQVLQFDAARSLGQLPTPPEGVRFDALLQTGINGWEGRRNGGGFVYDPPPARFRQSYTVGLLIEVEGDAPPDGGERPTGLVAVTSGIFCNNLGMAINGALATNIFNFLAERRVLLDIKGSRYVARHLEIGVDQMNHVWWFLVIYVPAGLLAGGLVVFWRRRQY
ncbi:MAG: Gldg family protein [Planctomycetota bacterium]|nr:Gldg family protein [Planctomycetota bacterium]